MFESAHAAILHADLDAFYASVELRDRPELAGRPLIVGGGVVLSASYDARRRGVRTAMGGDQARRLCPDAVVVGPNFERYVEASRHVFEIFDDTTPLVEGISIDEAFLDVSGLRRLSGDPVTIATRLRERVRNEVGLPITVGIARTKFLAKVASGVGKPDGLLLVEPANELDFLHGLQVERLWGVGKKSSQRLHDAGIHTVGDVARCSREFLEPLIGVAMARQILALAHNEDPRRVEPGQRRRSIGSQHAVGLGRLSTADAHAILLSLADRVTRRLRAADLAARTVTVRLRHHDYRRTSRAHSLRDASTNTTVIAHTAAAIFDHERDRLANQGLTMIGLTLSNLEPATHEQTRLDFETSTKVSRPRLDAALDQLKQRFGTSAVTRASSLGHRPDFELVAGPNALGVADPAQPGSRHGR